MRRRRNIFLKSYIGAVITYGIIMVIALVGFWFWLKEYEATRPETIVNKIVTGYLDNGDIWSLKKDYNLELSDYESKEKANSVIKGFLKKGNFKYSSTSQRINDCDMAYIVKSGERKILYVYLKKTEGKKFFGVNGYYVSSAKLDESLAKNIKLSIPSDTVVTVNGIAVADDIRKNANMPNIKDENLESEDSTFMQIVDITNLLDDSPDVKVTTKNGDAVDVNYNDGVFYANQNISEEISEKIKEIAVKAAKVYAAHMQNDATLSELSKYVDSSSDFYNQVKNTIVSFAWDHNGYEFKNVSCDDVIKYSSEIYGCRVKLRQILKNGSKIYEDKYDKYVYIRMNSKGTYVIDMQSVG